MLTTKKIIKFSKLSKEYGWLHLWSPHGIKYRYYYWPNCAHAWYGTRYHQLPYAVKIGSRILAYYQSTNIETVDLTLEILEEILYTKLTTHPILKTYLLETGDSEIIFTVSKFDTYDQKRLGFCEETNSGQNGLGYVWMKIREAIKKNS